MSTDAPRKIFLSHKSSNKARVLDFKEALEEQGYETWLDEDDMPAGTEIQRGLLQGMQESCAVVFFITPSFKDEHFLRSEINYAIGEKIDRGDDFAIITLQFIGDDGEKAPIPELLKSYVWKTPKTDFEALREIVRALPVAPGNIESQDEVATVATGPEIPSPAAGLSDEAKTILREASSDSSNGVIRNISTLGGDFIETNRKSLIPNQDSRTIARWIGGLRELQQYGCIRDLGSEAVEVFKVTREGYKLADAMNAGVYIDVTDLHDGGLSGEAKKILKEAVSGGGGIMNISTLGGQFIQVSGKALIPDQKPRTVACWIGGLEDLKRYEYIEDRTGEGRIFAVTREGYDAADEMLEA